jgi:hypothetical protein
LAVALLGCAQDDHRPNDKTTAGGKSISDDVDVGGMVQFRKTILPAWQDLARQINQFEGRYTVLSQSADGASQTKVRVRYSCLDESHRKLELLSTNGEPRFVMVVSPRHEFIVKPDNGNYSVDAFVDKEASSRFRPNASLLNYSRPIFAAVSTFGFRLDNLRAEPVDITRIDDGVVRLRYSIQSNTPTPNDVQITVDRRFGWAVTEWKIRGPVEISGRNQFDASRPGAIPVTAETVHSSGGKAIMTERAEFDVPEPCSLSRREFRPQHYGIEVSDDTPTTTRLRVAIFALCVFLLGCAAWKRFCNSL